MGFFRTGTVPVEKPPIPAYLGGTARLQELVTKPFSLKTRPARKRPGVGELVRLQNGDSSSKLCGRERRQPAVAGACWRALVVIDERSL
jgi:hypothetical protein